MLVLESCDFRVEAVSKESCFEFGRVEVLSCFEVLSLGELPHSDIQDNGRTYQTVS